MISTLILIVQGVLMGFVAGRAFPSESGWGSPEFWMICVVNAVAVVAYGVFKKTEE